MISPVITNTNIKQQETFYGDYTSQSVSRHHQLKAGGFR